MLKFPRKEEREQEKESEGIGKEGKERRREGMGIEWGGILGKEKCVERNERTWFATRKKNNLLGPDGMISDPSKSRQLDTL